jgi:hypothetical protein
LAKLKNAWDEFSMGILESDLVKFGVDILTKFLEIINKATSQLKGLGGTVTKVLTTVMLFKFGQKIYEQISKPLTGMIAKLKPKFFSMGEELGKSLREGMETGAGAK